MRETVRGVAGLAKRLGLHRNTVSKWVNTGLLDTALVVDFGRSYVFDVEEVFNCMKRTI